MTDDLKVILNAVETIGGQIKALETKMDKSVTETDRKIASIQLTLENEISKNIMTVAEGHLDLSRKFDEALKSDNEREILKIRVNILEN